MAVAGLGGGGGAVWRSPELGTGDLDLVVLAEYEQWPSPVSGGGGALWRSPELGTGDLDLVVLAE